MSAGLESNDARLIEGFRGFDPGDALMQLLSIQLRGLQDSTYLFLGVGSGVLNGAPKFSGGVEVGRTPGLIPEDLSKAEPRLLKFARFGLTGLIDPVHTPVFAAGLLKGLYDEITGYAVLIGSLNWDLVEMLMALAEDIRTQDGLAFHLGEQVGASFLGKVLEEAEGDDYRAFVFALGVLLGPFIIDLIWLILSGGAGPLFKRAAATAAALPGRGAALLNHLGRAAGDHLRDTARILDQLSEAPSLLVQKPATAGGAPWVGPIAGQGTPPRGALLSETGNGTRAVDDLSRGLGAAGDAAGSQAHGLSGPLLKTAASSPDAPGFSPGSAATGGAGSLGATAVASRAGRTILARSFQEANDAAIKGMMRAQATPSVIDQWPHVMEPSLADNLLPTPLVSRLLRDDFEPVYDPLIEFMRSGEILRGDVADLYLMLSRQREYHGTGTIVKIGAAVHKSQIHADDGFAAIATSEKVLRAHVGAIVRPGANRRRPTGLLRFNSDLLFSRLRSDIKKVLKSSLLRQELDRRGFLDEDTLPFLERVKAGVKGELAPYHAGHLFGPGMGAEAFAGLYMIPDFINVRAQAGIISNKVMGRATSRDLRLNNPGLSNEVKFWWRRDRAGVEGLIIDLARTASEAKRLNNVVALETFATTWGDELLETPFFTVAATLGLDLKPQYFTRAFDYHVFTLGHDASRIRAWGAPLTEVAPRLHFRLLVAPPPFQHARVYALDRYGGALGDAPFRDFDRWGLLNPQDRPRP